MENKRILYQFGAFPAIFFPSGKLSKGGSCEFATKKCLRWCEASTPINIEKETYKFFRNKRVLEIYRTIKKELEDRETKFLHWFASGDCPKKYTRKIQDIIEMLKELGVIQLVFTRNFALWKHFALDRQVRVVLSVDNKKDAEKILKTSYGVISVPNYKEGKINLYKDGTYRGGCGATFFEMDDIERENDCSLCYHQGVGCFSEI